MISMKCVKIVRSMNSSDENVVELVAMIVYDSLIYTCLCNLIISVVVDSNSWRGVLDITWCDEISFASDLNSVVGGFSSLFWFLPPMKPTFQKPSMKILFNTVLIDVT